MALWICDECGLNGDFPEMFTCVEGECLEICPRCWHDNNKTEYVMHDLRDTRRQKRYAEVLRKTWGIKD